MSTYEYYMLPSSDIIKHGWEMPYRGYLHRKIIQLLGDFAVPYVPEDMFAGLQRPCHYITSSIHLP